MKKKQSRYANIGALKPDGDVDKNKVFDAIVLYHTFNEEDILESIMDCVIGYSDFKDWATARRLYYLSAECMEFCKRLASGKLKKDAQTELFVSLLLKLREEIRPDIWIKELLFSDDSSLELQDSDILIVVGPNNSGKSAALNDICVKIKSKTQPGIVIKEVTINKSGDLNVLKSWVQKHTHTNTSSPKNHLYQLLDYHCYDNSIQGAWNQASSNGLQDLGGFFCHLLKTEERLSVSKPPQSVNLLESHKTHPIHILQENDELEKHLSTIFNQAFGQDLIVNRGAGGNVPLHVGIRPQITDGEDRVSKTYLEKLRKLPQLQEQGDGMRSFFGVLVYCITLPHSVQLIDEPEAFLHPPQAYLIGKLLASEAPPKRQMIIATHSGDILKGLLQADANKRVRVVRITRNGNINNIKQLQNEELGKLWGDPLLRYSNILDGLFHERVIVCEGDADCRFYQAVLEALPDEIKNNAPDTLFVHCGGKDRMPTVLKSLQAIGVNSRAIVDFDIFSNINPLKLMVEILGDSWSETEALWRPVKTAIDQKAPELEISNVKSEIIKILDETEEQYLSRPDKRKVDSVLRKGSPWRVAKGAGSRIVPSGDIRTKYNDLIEKLFSIGIFVTEVGELEGFVPTVGNHGPKWVTKVIESKKLETDPELEGARKFVKKVAVD